MTWQEKPAQMSFRGTQALLVLSSQFRGIRPWELGCCQKGAVHA